MKEKQGESAMDQDSNELEALAKNGGGSMPDLSGMNALERDRIQAEEQARLQREAVEAERLRVEKAAIDKVEAAKESARMKDALGLAGGVAALAIGATVAAKALEAAPAVVAIKLIDDFAQRLSARRESAVPEVSTSLGLKAKGQP